MAIRIAPRTERLDEPPGGGEPVDALARGFASGAVALKKRVREVRVDDSLNDYLLDIVDATRKHEELALGVSPRGALTLYRAVQGLALFSGRDYAIPTTSRPWSVRCWRTRVVPKGMLRDGLRQRNRAILQQLLAAFPCRADGGRHPPLRRPIARPPRGADTGVVANSDSRLPNRTHPDE